MAPSIAAAAMSLCLTLLQPATAPTPGQPAPAGSDRVARWTQDIDALTATLFGKHKNAFHTTPRAELERDAATIKAELSSLSDTEVALRLVRFVARVGDAHTSLNVSGRVPLRAYAFDVAFLEDGVFLTALTKDHAEFLGGQVVAVNGVPTADAVTRISALTSHENRAWAEVQARNLMKTVEVLQHVGLADAAGGATLTVRLMSGETRPLALAPVVPPFDRSQVVSAPLPEGVPESLRPRSQWYGYRKLPEARAMYVFYDRCADQPGRPAVAEWVKAVLAEWDSMSAAGSADRLVLDLRRNTGGNSALLQPLVAGLAERPAMQRKHAITVLIGRNTFSSGMMNAYELRDRAKATLVGTPTGGKPNSFGETRTFDLPHSRFTLQYCTKLFRPFPDDDRPSLEPDVAAPTTSKDYFNPRDVALEAALALKPQ